jgi:hypothetical protein
MCSFTMGWKSYVLLIVDCFDARVSPIVMSRKPASADRVEAKPSTSLMRDLAETL